MSNLPSEPAVDVAIVCSGLGRVARGYESFAAETYRALHAHPSLRLRLFGSSGSRVVGATEVRCLSQSGKLAAFVGKLCQRDAYFVEQATFVLSFLPYLLTDPPDVILCSDRSIIDLLWLIRRSLKLQYRILGSNGGPIGPPFFRLDLAQHLVSASYEASLKMGEDPRRNTLVPYGFSISKPEYLGDARQKSLREELRLPVDRRIVLAVGAVNISQKRMDYIVREIAAIRQTNDSERPFLMILGQVEKESSVVVELATRLLGVTGFSVRSATASEVYEYYQAADVFVLASLKEAFGRVIVEAASTGLPCIVNENENTVFILGEYGLYGDLRKDRVLGVLIDSAMSEAPERANARARRMYEMFSWRTLEEKYVEMFRRCRQLPMQTTIRNN